MTDDYEVEIEIEPSSNPFPPRVCYFIKGTKMLHRKDGPAIIHGDGTEEWYRLGERHREDGPATIFPDGTQIWYHKGLRHRDDGPAVIHVDGTVAWYCHGDRHRTDGPAFIGVGGSMSWYLKGIRFRSSWSYQINSGLTDEQMLMMVLKYGSVR